MKAKGFSLLLTIILISAASILCTSCGASGDNADSGADSPQNDLMISKLSEELEISGEQAIEIAALLAASGFPDEIDYITRWNDAETNEPYYRIRSGSVSRDLYLYSDGTYKLTYDEIIFEGGTSDSDTTDIASEPPGSISETDTDTSSKDDPDTTADIETDEPYTDTDPPETVPDITSDTTPDTAPDTKPDTTPDTAPDTTPDTTPGGDTLKFEIVLNTNSKKYHYPDCSSVSRMKEKNKSIIYISSVDELFELGYDPCGICAKADRRE